MSNLAAEMTSAPKPARIHAALVALAVMSGLFGVLLLLAGLAMPFSASTMLDQHAHIRVFGLTLYGAAGLWFLWAPIRFLRRPSGDRALAICARGSVLLALVTLFAGVLVATMFEEGSMMPYMAAPIAALGAGFLLHFVVLRPRVQRAFPEIDL